MILNDLLSHSIRARSLEDLLSGFANQCLQKVTNSPQKFPISALEHPDTPFQLSRATELPAIGAECQTVQNDEREDCLRPLNVPPLRKVERSLAKGQ
jgi:hypothetical protein